MPGPEGISFNPEEFKFSDNQSGEYPSEDFNVEKIEQELRVETENLKKLEILRSELSATITID